MMSAIKRSRMSIPPFLGRSVDFTRPFESVNELCAHMDLFATTGRFSYVHGAPDPTSGQLQFDCAQCKNVVASSSAIWRFSQSVARLSDDAPLTELDPQLVYPVHSVCFSVKPEKDACGHLYITVEELQEEHCCKNGYISYYKAHKRVNVDLRAVIEKLRDIRAETSIYDIKQIDTLTAISDLVKKLE